MKLNTPTLALLFILIAAGVPAASAQESSKNMAPIGVPQKLPVVSARVVGQELLITYSIPPGQHATVRESFNFMTVTTTEIKGLKFGETIYPEAEKDDEGNTEYHGTVILKKSITVLPEYDFTPQTMDVTAGYQLCLDSGICMPPKTETIKLSFTLKKK